MAVHQPSTRIVGGKRQDQIATGGQRGGVATGWIDKLQARDVTVPLAGARAQHVEVVAMKMDWVGDVDNLVRAGLDDPVVPLGMRTACQWIYMLTDNSR